MRNWKEKLFFGALPRGEDEIAVWLRGLKQHKIDWVITLLSDDELSEISPEFAQWRDAQIGYDTLQIPMPDGGVPTAKDEIELFWDSALDVAKWVDKQNQRVFVHCAEGIGRTGTFAAAVLQGLGYSPDEAVAEIHACGSEPETDVQDAFLAAGPPPLMIHNRQTYGFDWGPHQKALTREIIETVDVAAFSLQFGGPNKGCMLNHLDGKTGYLSLEDALADTYRVFDYDTDELLGSYPDIDTLVNSGWKVST